MSLSFCSLVEIMVKGYVLHSGGLYQLMEGKGIDRY